MSNIKQYRYSHTWVRRYAGNRRERRRQPVPRWTGNLALVESQKSEFQAGREDQVQNLQASLSDCLKCARLGGVMCGRYRLTHRRMLEIQQCCGSDDVSDLTILERQFNIPPREMAAIVFEQRGQRRLTAGFWSLMPPWVETLEQANKLSTFNAKATLKSVEERAGDVV